MASENLVNIGSGNGVLPDAPNHYLIQSWLIISEVFWNSPHGNITENAQDIYVGYEFEND